MATKHPRINVVLEEPVYAAVKRIAKGYKASMSNVIRDMVKEEIENFEDNYLENFAESRAKTLKKAGALKHNDFWKKVL